MKKVLRIYKGYPISFFDEVDVPPLMDFELKYKLDINNYNNDYQNSILTTLMSFKGEKYILYEEFILINELGEKLFEIIGVDFVLFKNWMFPDYYPQINDNVNFLDTLAKAYEYLNSPYNEEDIPDSIKQCLRFYGDIKFIDGVYFVSYKNLEKTLSFVKEETYTYDNGAVIDLIKTQAIDSHNYVFEFNTEIENYLRLTSLLMNNRIQSVGIKINDETYYEKYIKNNLCVLISKYKSTEFYRIKENLEVKPYDPDIANYLKKVWGYEEFRNLLFYENPDENNNVIEISQGQIIDDIITQSENAFSNRNYKDISITAPTGAGKSIIFQIASLYLAEKYSKVTIIISPLIALMKDQIKNLHSLGIYNAAYINSELNFLEKEEIIRKIKEEEIDILYLAPETLLSYSVENFIGNREIGLFIVDEAHIVTTWGKGFRPDYWYLGKYLSRIRTDLHKFPIVTFTATAVYGGNDDMYEETIESLNMKSTIKYLGNIKRDNISFDISIDLNRIGKSEYDYKKTKSVEMRLNTLLQANKKTIVYFPYASTATSLIEENELIGIRDEIAVYTGRSRKEQKSLSEKEFSEGSKKVMFATKAFGMGIDIDDIDAVYHYAPTGNLNDYVQEIGRAARKKNIEGIAYIDFMEKDFDFVNALYGMSSIKQYQAKAVLKKIYSIYEQREKQNFLVTPNDFSYIFFK